jgi:beta-galactosidase
MRDVLVYYRNNPSILFWGAGNNWITADHMRQMVDLRRAWDPNGGRAMGCRAISGDPAWGTAAVDAAEYVGTMLNRHYSVYARDRKPIIECECTRDEAPRRVWDNFSPPDFGYLTGPDVTYHWNSEEFAGTLAASLRYEFWSQRIQNPASDLHIIGHWTYPAGTRKSVYVMASAPVRRVRLLVNGTLVGDSSSPSFDFLHTFPNVTRQSGTITAIGLDAAGTEVVTVLRGRRAVDQHAGRPPAAAELYRAGLSPAKIAERYGTTTSSVRKGRGAKVD